jgi:hypothetical protein
MTRTKNNLKDFIVVDKKVTLDDGEKCFVIMDKESRILYLATKQGNFIVSKDEDRNDRIIQITDEDIKVAEEIATVSQYYFESLALITGLQYSLAQNKIDIILTGSNKEKIYRIARESASCNSGFAEEVGVELYALPNNMTDNNKVLYELLFYIFPQIIDEYNLSKEQKVQLELIEGKLLQKYQQVRNNPSE